MNPTFISCPLSSVEAGSLFMIHGEKEIFYHTGFLPKSGQIRVVLHTEKGIHYSDSPPQFMFFEEDLEVIILRPMW